MRFALLRIGTEAFLKYEALTLSTGHTLLEGPRWHDGDLYVSDFFTERVLRFRNGGPDWDVVCEVPGRPSGLGFLPDGDMLVVSMMQQRVLRWNGSKLTEWADLRGLVLGPLNDMLVDDKGRCYIGNFGHSAETESDFGPTPLLFVGTDRRAQALELELNFPNGMVLLNGELLVAETYGGRIRAFKVGQDGLPGDGRIWAQFGDPIDYFDIERAHAVSAIEPDGLALGGDGTIWVADAKGRGVSRIREGGEVLDFVDTGLLSAFATAVDSQGHRLFATCAPPNRTVRHSELTSSVLMCADLSPNSTMSARFETGEPFPATHVSKE
jgi:sugar lactone lactonase YvrE